MQTHRSSSLLWAFGLALLLAFAFLTLTTRAQGLPAAPSLTVREAYAFRNVAVAGDVAVIYRASLPSVNWTTYTADGALAVLLESGTEAIDSPPAIGEVLGGFYLDAGHSYTWGASPTIDLVANPALFSTSASSTLAVTEVATTALIATSTADQVIMCNTFESLLANLEDQDASDSYENLELFNGNNITLAGTNVVLAAFPAALDVLPSCFVVGVQSAQAFQGGDEGLLTATSASVGASAQWARFSAMAADYGFSDPYVASGLLGLGFVGVLFVVFSLLSNSFMYGSVVGGYAFVTAAMMAPFFLLKAAFITAALLAMGAGAYLFGRVPR